MTKLSFLPCRPANKSLQAMLLKQMERDGHEKRLIMIEMIRTGKSLQTTKLPNHSDIFHKMVAFSELLCTDKLMKL